MFLSPFLLPLLLPFLFHLCSLCPPFSLSTLLSSAVAIRSRVLRQTIRTVTSVRGSPLPLPLLAHLPLTPTHPRARPKPPLWLGKGRYSCMIVTMKECFKAIGFNGEKHDLLMLRLSSSSFLIY